MVENKQNQMLKSMIKNGGFYIMKKKFLTFTSCILASCMMFSLTACDLFNKNDEKQAYVSLDINPAIELIVDKDNKVVSVRGENEDGQVLLYQESNIKGEKIDDAIKKITDLAIEYGYLSEDNKVVNTIVTSGNDSFANEILSKVNTSITATAENLGLNVTIDGEGAYSLLRKMNEIKKQFPNNQAVQNMTVQKFKLALSVSETGEITLEAAIALDDAELIEMLNKANSKIEEFATETYTKAKAKALAIYDKATEIAGYAVYTQYYFEKILSHPLTAYYGGAYQVYAAAAKGLNAVCDICELANEVKNYPLSDEQVNAIVIALGLESADPLKNSNGDVTIESVEAYADVLFKNSPASEILEQKKADLTAALNQAETVIKEKIDEITTEYKPQIEATLTVARQILASVETIMNTMPESIKTVLNTATSDLKTILSEIDSLLDGDKIELSELRDKANRLDAKAQEYLNLIKSDLSKEELQELEDKRLAVIEKMTAQKQELEQALEDAEQAAKDYLAGLKNARKNANT